MCLLLIFHVFFFLYRLTVSSSVFFFFFNDTATTEIYTLSLHDALPIYSIILSFDLISSLPSSCILFDSPSYYFCEDRKSTRLNSSHANISYAVFCLKKKKIN